MHYLYILLGAYLLGAIPSAWLVAKANGVNILRVGSGSAGFTNVWRSVGLKAAAIVFVADIAKGTAAAALGFWLGGHFGMLLGAVCAIFGHTYSCFIGFKGGKGVATGAGTLLFVSPVTFVVCLLTLASVAFITRYMSAGSILAAIVCPLSLMLDRQPAMVVVVYTLCCVYIIWKHRSNIGRIRSGTENKLRF